MGHRLIFTNNVKTTLHNKYVVGAPVGGLNRSVKRALQRRASNNAQQEPCCIKNNNNNITL